MERNFIYSCLIRFLMSLSWTMINILLVLYAATFPGSGLHGTLWSVIGLSRLLSETPGGILVDRVGSKPVIIGGLATIGAAYLVFASSQTALDVLIAGAVAGSGFAVAAIGLMVHAASYTPPDERTRYMGILQGSMMASSIVGPTLGGVIADTGGLRTPFFASAVTAGTGLLLALVLRGPSTVSREGTGMGVFRAYVGFVQRRLYLALFVVSYLYSLIGWGFRSLILPLYGQGVLALTVTQIGLLSSITSVLLFLIQFFLSGRLERVMGRRRRLTLGLVLCGGAIYGYSTTAHLYGVAAFSAVLGLGLGIVSPSLEALWIDITDPAERGRVYGLRTAFFDVGQISWSLILTALATMNPIAPLYLAGATALITGLLLFVVLRTRRVQ